MLDTSIAVLVGIFLAFSNGANDNFKGVATLLGSKTTTYKKALVWATITTLAGSLTAFILAKELLVNFSGKGLIPDEILSMQAFPLAVAFAAASTVFLATRFGFPISTTHAIVGSLVGAALVASPAGINFNKLFSSFFLPLISSPVLSLALTVMIYPLLSLLKKQMGIKRQSCICIGSEVIALAPQGVASGELQSSFNILNNPTISIGTTATCEERYTGEFLGVSAKPVLDGAHFLSSGMVGFARGLNDTPKIAAIMIAGSSLSPLPSIALVTVVMAIGGISYSKKVAETMAYQITTMNDGQGFTANFITSTIVIAASRFGLPVSTTHVSCGSLFGIGTTTKQANWGIIMKIILSWVTTLPIAASLSAASYWIFSTFIL